MNEWFEAEQRAERALQFVESQRWAEALAEIEAAIAINPHNAAWHAQHGYLLEELDRTLDAVAAYEESLSLDGDDAEVSLALGVAFLRLNRYAQAIEQFEALATAHPDLEPAYCHRISAYTELGRHDRAEEMFYLAQQLDEDCPHCFFSMGASLAARGQAKRAIYCWKRVLDLEPAYIGVNRRIAQAYRAQGRLDLAREYFLAELRDDPGNTDLLFELADLSIESGQFGAAAAKLGQILELAPLHPRARFALGNLWLRRNYPKQALECFSEVQLDLDDDPRLSPALLDEKTGEALMRLGKFADALPALQRASKCEKPSARVMMLLGNCLMGLRQFDVAADCYRRVLAHDAKHAQSHHNLAVCQLRAGRFDSGLAHCLEALRAKPDYTTAMYHASIAMMELGQWAEAKNMLIRAKKSDPESEAIDTFLRGLWKFRLRSWGYRFIAIFGFKTPRKIKLQIHLE